MRSSVPCRTSPRGGAILSPLDKQQEDMLLPVECQQGDSITTKTKAPVARGFCSLIRVKIEYCGLSFRFGARGRRSGNHFFACCAPPCPSNRADSTAGRGVLCPCQPPQSS